MEKLALDLINSGGIAGVVVVFLSLVIGTLIKLKGWPLFGSPRGIAGKDVGDILERFTSVVKRLDRIETDLEARPSREEMQDIHLQLARADERLNGIQSVVHQVRHGVLRIEDFLFSYARNERKGDGHD